MHIANATKSMRSATSGTKPAPLNALRTTSRRYSKKGLNMLSKKDQLKSKPKKPRARKCLSCRQWFKPKEQGVTTCSEECAILYGRSNFTKQVKREKAKAKKEHYENDKSKLTKQAQFQFNKYIRLRDKHLPCISCGNTTRQMHAGHFMPVGSNGHIRFDEANCHKQCSICNNHKSGNLTEYEPNLVLKIGQKEVDRLKVKFTRSYTVQELKDIIELYKSKIRELDE